MDLAVGVAVDLHGLYRRQPGGGMASQTQAGQEPLAGRGDRKRAGGSRLRPPAPRRAGPRPRAARAGPTPGRSTGRRCRPRRLRSDESSRAGLPCLFGPQQPHLAALLHAARLLPGPAVAPIEVGPRAPRMAVPVSWRTPAAATAGRTRDTWWPGTPACPEARNRRPPPPNAAAPGRCRRRPWAPVPDQPRLPRGRTPRPGWH